MKKLDWRKVTVIFISIFIVAGVAYDVLVINISGPQNSISQVIIDWTYKFPIFTYCAGILSGHLFWQMSKIRKVELLQARVKELERQIGG